LKRIFAVVSISGLFIVGVFLLYEYKLYNLTYSEKMITEYIHSQFKEFSYQPILLELFSIEDSNAVVATFIYKEEEQIGAIVFQKGLNQRLKPVKQMAEHTYYSELINTNKGTYALFIGENLQTSIQTIETDIIMEKNNIKISVPPQKYFAYYEKMENALKTEVEPSYHFRTLKGAINGSLPETEGMDLMFVDEENRTFLLHSENENILKTTLGSYQHSEDGFSVTDIKQPSTYSLAGEKSFCFDEKRVRADLEELTYIHGLVPYKDAVKMVVLEVELENKLIFKNEGEVVSNQFFIHISMPDILYEKERVVKKFHLYDEQGRHIGTEFKS
jgi:hypothetical protein